MQKWRACGLLQAFKQYASLVEKRLMPKYGATCHWAKLEVPESEAGLKAVRQRLAARYPVQEFNKRRAELDPRAILANDWLVQLFGAA